MADDTDLCLIEDSSIVHILQDQDKEVTESVEVLEPKFLKGKEVSLICKTSCIYVISSYKFAPTVELRIFNVG